MPWMKWLPWRFFVRKFATAHGFLDPLAVMARLQRFAEPSEVSEPIELLRAGVIFHARALMNSKVIQHNLDWVWPYWIERQFDPADVSFIPRAFSITHCNLSHRNWTAVGVPGSEEMPIVDPRGLLVPHYDGWSVDSWVIGDDEVDLYPSKCQEGQVTQKLDLKGGVAVVTESANDRSQLTSRVWAELDTGSNNCHMQLRASHQQGGWLVVALRPCNPEGVAFINKISLDSNRNSWTVDGKDRLYFDRPVDRHHASDYRKGDIALHLRDQGNETHTECEVGMATAAALFRIEPGQTVDTLISIPQHCKLNSGNARDDWKENLDQHCAMSVPDAEMQFLYDAAVRTLILHSPHDVYPGPYTYKRFWFRDAAFMIQSLLHAGLLDRAERALERFPSRQKRNGYFHSQDGEWDSNGEALWIIDQYCRITGHKLKQEWLDPVLRGTQWIHNKRLPKDGSLTGGLLPAGFSAEHLGPNDCYFWDDFWSIAGQQSAVAICQREGHTQDADTFQAQADDFMLTVDDALQKCATRLKRPAMPASPNRRLDAGAIGSIAAGYPLKLYDEDDPRLLDLVEFLLENCFVSGGFFQDMIHSGINAYLTIHVAQVLLRAGDPRCIELMRNVAKLASPTGQWPEAIHPHSFGGCMGDGQHAWAAAEWVTMQRNCFVREEGDTLILASGLPPEWLSDINAQEMISFGPAPTHFGTIWIEIIPGDTPRISWRGKWHEKAPPIEVRAFGYHHVVPERFVKTVELQPK
ncbi:hypothetical protein M0G74_06460 [Microbulbifer sp. CAU 1566]|uniref:hypothetical protein n=1 Tax=Microbulbifer sp. CAU 1566 TaxID=2933269 RepID=UPI00200394CB|nr:hypothetical protein [Microbulbifer sp. CAU 1566]MCK7596912.1 hypothetical protein [Microbulbifer sp. CAU 1566]